MFILAPIEQVGRFPDNSSNERILYQTKSEYMLFIPIFGQTDSISLRDDPAMENGTLLILPI